MAQPWILMCSKQFFTSYHFLWEGTGFGLLLHPDPTPPCRQTLLGKGCHLSFLHLPGCQLSSGYREWWGCSSASINYPLQCSFQQEAHLVVPAGKGRWRGGGGRREASRFLIGFSSLFACPICFQKALFCSNPFFLHPSSLAG